MAMEISHPNITLTLGSPLLARRTASSFVLHTKEDKAQVAGGRENGVTFFNEDGMKEAVRSGV